MFILILEFSCACKRSHNKYYYENSTDLASWDAHRQPLHRLYPLAQVLVHLSQMVNLQNISIRIATVHTQTFSHHIFIFIGAIALNNVLLPAD